MRLQDDIDFTTLTWVKGELDETLKQARHALEAFVEDPTDASQMRFCATYLHQVQGTLRMVELYGAAMVTEEMEQLATALLNDEIKDRDEAYTVLMRGIVQLPDYLERLQTGYKDIPIVLLPLLNDLRACRGEKLLSESVLFSPDLSAPLPGAAAGPQQATPDLELKALAARLRNNYQAGLLHWFRDKNATQSIGGLIGTLDRLRTITAQDEARRLWWVAAGVLDAVHRGGIEASVALKLLFGRVDREIKRMADAGEGSFRVEPPRELVKNLLYYAAHTQADTERLRELRETYRLDALLPSAQELDHAKGSLAGKNRALLDTVSTAIKEDLMRVKDALDLHLRTMDAKPAELAAQTDVLDRVADTLGMLGLGVPRRVVQEQRSALMDISSGSRPADESALLDIAGALLYVEAAEMPAFKLAESRNAKIGDPIHILGFPGVVLTHANLLANVRVMGKAARAGADDVFVSWLPLYHDMGLIGGCFATMVLGFPVVLMSPLAFLSRPVAWMQAIHRHRGTMSGGPNFSFELCLKRIADEDMEGLVLSCWRFAFNAAEPVSPETIVQFEQRFGRWGLRRNCLSPSYGLAESSVGVAITVPGTPWRAERLEREHFTRTGEALEARPDDASPLTVGVRMFMPRKAGISCDHHTSPVCGSTPANRVRVWTSNCRRPAN